MRKPDYDSRVIIYRSRQLALLVFVLIATAGFTLIIAQGTINNLGFWAIGAPICLFGGLFILVPPTEVWEYKPWQSKARQVEQKLDR